MTASTDEKQLRILAIHRYFWPDSAPYAIMLKSIVERLALDGHKVHVLSSLPSYKTASIGSTCAATEVCNGVAIRRLDLKREIGRPLRRVFNSLKLAVSVLYHAVVRERFDVIMISTAPPVVGGAAASIAARLTGARFVYHCMDIHPEIGRLSGEFRNSLVFRALRRVDTWTCKSANPVVVLSRDMQSSLTGRPNAGKPIISIINNFELPAGRDSDGVQLPDGLEQDSSVLRILFAGNIGRFQNLDVVLDAFDLIRDVPDVECVFVGEGAAKDGLERRVRESGDRRLRFYAHLPVGLAIRAMRAADLGLVLLARDVYRYAFPSKTMTYFSAGLPVLVGIEATSELARMVAENDVGFTVPSGDAAKMAQVIRETAANRDRLESMRGNAARLAAASFAERHVLDQWSGLMAKQQIPG